MDLSHKRPHVNILPHGPGHCEEQTVNEIDTTPETPLTSPDPFLLAKEVRGKVKTCCGGAHPTGKIEYLWIHASHEGIGGRPGALPLGDPLPSLDHWLNVVDEAASLGAKWLMLTVHSPLSDSPDALTLCHWAQSAHGMGIAIHTTASALSENDIQAIEALDLTLVRLFVNGEALDAMKSLEARGIQVRPAEIRHAGPAQSSGCAMPQNMLYVNAKGELYTCGMVNGNTNFRLGDIYSRPFGSVVDDPCLKHSIPAETPYEDHGCDGCPPLLANSLHGH